MDRESMAKKIFYINSPNGDWGFSRTGNEGAKHCYNIAELVLEQIAQAKKETKIQCEQMYASEILNENRKPIPIDKEYLDREIAKAKKEAYKNIQINYRSDEDPYQRCQKFIDELKQAQDK